MRTVFVFAVAALLASLLSCEAGPRHIELPRLPEREQAVTTVVFTCEDERSTACEAGTHYTCRRNNEFLEVDEERCSARDLICDPQAGCVVCQPDQLRCKACEGKGTACDPDTVQRCSADRAWQDVVVCDLAAGDACHGGRCENACETAAADRSYQGCEFYAADLDNAAIDDMSNAAAQQYAIVVANPQRVPARVRIERNAAAFGEPRRVESVQERLVAPGDLEVFELPQREVDGSRPGHLNDGTHTAVTSAAYRVVASHPITAYQFNPLENANVFSNDASLLLPVSALGDEYTVVGWPQTIGDSSDPEKDFDATAKNEDLRAFLTIVGTAEATALRVELGAQVVEVVGAGPVPKSSPGDVIELTVGPFDVVNLETQGLNADFTGSRVRADKPVVVFVGSEASDVPRFGTYETRQCCADHLEEQLLPDVSAGTRFIIARMPPRTVALEAAALAGMPLGVATIEEPEWVRIQAIDPGETHIVTTLPEPQNEVTLAAGTDTILRADRDFVITADRPVAVLQALPSQGVTGIARYYPGGDPSILTVPPVEQFRRDYIFLTPDKYAFDFVTIVAQADAVVVLDGQPLPETCIRAPIAPDAQPLGDAAVQWVVHRCQLSFPVVTAGADSMILPGVQHDGVHTLVATREVGIVVYGFDRFVSYAYVGGLDLEALR